MIRFENTSRGHNKFYEIYTSGEKVTTRYGAIGTAGVTVVKRFSSPIDAADWVFATQVAKAKHGYVKCDDEGSWRSKYESAIKANNMLIQKINGVVRAIEALR